MISFLDIQYRVILLMFVVIKDNVYLVSDIFFIADRKETWTQCIIVRWRIMTWTRQATCELQSVSNVTCRSHSEVEVKHHKKCELQWTSGIGQSNTFLNITFPCCRKMRTNYLYILKRITIQWLLLFVGDHDEILVTIDNIYRVSCIIHVP